MKRLIQMALAGMMTTLLVAQEPPPSAVAPERDSPRAVEGADFGWSALARREKTGPMNLSLVLNCSKGSERRFEFMRNAAIEMVKGLTETDLVSVVVFSDRASVLVAAQPAVDKGKIVEKLQALKPAGGAALFAGISAAAAEIRRTRDERLSNCIWVMGSFGTVGPSSDHDLMTIANALSKEGIRLVMPGRMMMRRGMGIDGFRGRPGGMRPAEGDWRSRWRERFNQSTSPEPGTLTPLEKTPPPGKEK